MAEKEKDKNVEKSEAVKASQAVKAKPAPKQAEPLAPVEQYAAEANLKTWQIAALRRYAKWADGKQITRSQFDAAVSGFKSRVMGGGKAA
jgi:hypothetical protein